MTLEEAKKEINKLDSGSSFFGRDYEAGWEDALHRAKEVLDKVESSGNPEQLTLKELARELRKIFMFKYLTVSNTYGYCINVWKYFKPEWNESDGEWIGCYMAFDVYPDGLRCKLDFSEYVDADGDVDFSKCIVEVE